MMQNDSRWRVRRVAVLGAGVMGAQIAAHLVNANIETMLYDLPATGADPDLLVKTAIVNLTKLSPPPFASTEKQWQLVAANYKDHLPFLKTADLIIEAVTENKEIKEKIYKDIAPHVGDHTIIATNTSGISINDLAETLPAQLRERFVGIHFFNPPRYMRLVELIPHEQTRVELISQLEAFLVSTLGKGVVHAKDTPNFIANRIGVFSLLTTFMHATEYHIPLEVVDQLTGPTIGRAKSATFRTADLVGLDTLSHVVNTMMQYLKTDPWHRYFQLPDWMNTLIKEKSLGQKTRKGIYWKKDKELYIYDVDKKEYRLANQTADPALIQKIKTLAPNELFVYLRGQSNPQAQFLWACFRDLFHYSAFHLAEIGETVRDVDLALRWGFAWKQGPFELWQHAGWETIASMIKEDITADKVSVDAPLPNWVFEHNEVYGKAGAYSPQSNQLLPRSDAQVYKRQASPDTLPGELPLKGQTIFETADAVCWHMNDDIAILSFKTKANTVSQGVLDNILQAVQVAEQKYRGLVLWQFQGEHFSVGANLKEFSSIVKEGQQAALEQAVLKFQQTSLRLRYSLVPTVAAIQGYVFGGGCELAMHCTRVVAALETYMGLVETGVGLLPAGGGCKEFALRASELSSADSLSRHVGRYFELIGKAVRSDSAWDAKAKHYLQPTDTIIVNPYELLYVAKQQVHALSESNYRPPISPRIAVAGREGITLIKSVLTNLYEGHFITEHDHWIGSQVANVICGGEIDPGTVVNEEWLLRLERNAFVKLAFHEKTQQRIQFTLENGRPLRN